ncbi:hypothetical protein BS78_K038600 [Paspalum vaginatum]|uniref:Protein kinase domain-containing protein n=1 Tax=Paspalum vaginatum TaxID=158149 RepID=A0A9W8CFM3_9POAL|nr:hypothetical protein BS78_K038600 [Paspalum vaginatum]
MTATGNGIKDFTEDEIRRITSNYSTPIGRGGFGEVYRGIIDGEYDLVAVKKYFHQDFRKEFMDEVRIHSQMNHKNVVKFIGYCIGESTLILVTEYISNGNLEDILHKRDISIPLDIRLGIAIGCAEALSYMHSLHLSTDNLIYHGDIKPANILLDDNLTAKVSDFGLSRLLFGGDTQFTISLKGSMGYMDPIYFHEGCLTPRSDIYSFGVVLLELITRKRTLQEIRKLSAECVALEIRKHPQMNEVAKRLRMLKNELKGSPQSILATYSGWHSSHKKGTSKPSFKKGLSFFKGSHSSSKVLSDLVNVRNFTTEEIEGVTHNYLCLLSGGKSAAEVYKGALEDNTLVEVHKYLYVDSEEAFINGGIILAQIVHKNIIRILGCCLEAKSLAFIYEYVPKGSLSDILGGQEDFPLDLRMRIAIKTAEALQYLHSSAAGIIGHGGVSSSTILLDNNFTPKLTDFSRACKLIKNNETTAGVISSSILEEVIYNDTARYGSVLMNLESDIYRFGGVLMALISGDKNIDHNDLVMKFTQAYETDKSGKALFDKDITAEEDITLLDEIGRLALRCTVWSADKMVMRPTMKETAEQLRIIRRSWMEHRAEEAIQVTESFADVVPAEPRIPNLMRHLFGYRRISTSDPIRAC